MFDRFTDRARKVMGLARQEAQRFNHDYCGTEHILLGLLSEGSGVAASVIRNLDIDIKRVRRECEKLVSTGTTMVTMGQLPFTPRAKKVLELALEESSNLGHTYVGTEHLLLGLIRETEGIAAQTLRALRIKVEDVREEVLELLGAEPTEMPTTRTRSQGPAYKAKINFVQKVVKDDHDYLNNLIREQDEASEMARQRAIKGTATPIAAEVVQEILRATAIHTKRFSSAHEGWAVIMEELDELWDEVRAKHHDKVKMRKEAIQTAAMAIRFIMDVCEDE